VILSLGDGTLLAGRTSAAAFPRLQYDLQTFLATDAAHTLPIDDPSFSAKLRRQSAMPISRKFPRQLDDPFPYPHRLLALRS